MKKIGFIGTGIMGQSMVKNLMRAGFELYIYSRTKEKALELINMGATWCNSIEELSKGKDAIITIVGYPSDVESVYDTLLHYTDKSCYLIDMTTSSPAIAKTIYEKAKAKGIYALDAPVSGGKTGAAHAKLTIMVGGDKEAFDACMPVFEAMGTSINHIGGAGAGQITKAANQIAIAGALAGVCEAITIAKKTGLDPEKVVNAISGGAAGSFQLTHNAKPMLNDEMAPTFYLKHYVKDLKIAQSTAEDSNATLPVLQKVLQMFAELEANGEGDYGTQALIHHYK